MASRQHDPGQPSGARWYPNVRRGKVDIAAFAASLPFRERLREIASRTTIMT